MQVAQDENFWSGNTVELVLFAVGVVFTFTLFGVFVYVLNRKDESDDSEESSDL